MSGHRPWAEVRAELRRRDAERGRDVDATRAQARDRTAAYVREHTDRGETVSQPLDPDDDDDDTSRALAEAQDADTPLSARTLRDDPRRVEDDDR